MCRGCWNHYGSSTALPKEAPSAIDLITEIYNSSEGGAGGNLHIVLDDWNLETEHIEWCLGVVAQKQAGFGDRDDRCEPYLLLAERSLLNLLMPMTESERAAVLGKYEGFF